jgi:hypothetical protein
MGDLAGLRRFTNSIIEGKEGDRRFAARAVFLGVCVLMHEAGAFRNSLWRRARGGPSSLDAAVSAATPHARADDHQRDYRIRAPNALAASSTASAAVAFSRSRIGLTSTISNEPSRPDSATSSIARCASR